MSRRKKRSSKQKKPSPPPAVEKSNVEKSTAEKSNVEQPAVEIHPPRPRKWFLATTICLEVAWLAFLLFVGIKG